MNDYYVVLTGAFDNAGDFLIRDRAIRLLKRYRPDRELHEWSRREPLSKERLEFVNGAKALILTGGPSIQPNMFPGVFPLTPNLDDIKVPIILYGAGWKGGGGSWRHENAYRLSDTSIKLLKRIADDGHRQSVRDFHTFRLLSRYGVEHVLVTGCPALYGRFVEGENPIGFVAPTNAKRIAISTGVKFVTDKRLAHQFFELLNATKRQFPASDVTVAFHHSIDPEMQKAAYGTVRNQVLEAHKDLIARIEDETAAELAFVGGGLKGMTDAYDRVDLHLGYRVHAHVYMTSIGKPSYLLAEDGRGVSMGQLVGPERTVVAVESTLGRLRQILGRIRPSIQTSTNDQAIDQLISVVRLDKTYDWNLSRKSVNQLRSQFPVMESFLKGLP